MWQYCQKIFAKRINSLYLADKVLKSIIAAEYKLEGYKMPKSWMEAFFFCLNSCYKAKTRANGKSYSLTNFHRWIPLVLEFYQPSRTSEMAGVVAGKISCLWFAVVLLSGFSVIYQEAKEDSTDA